MIYVARYCGVFNAHYQYHLQGVTRNPIAEGGLADFLPKKRFLFQLAIISDCYTKLFNLSNSNIPAQKLLGKIRSFAYFLTATNAKTAPWYGNFVCYLLLMKLIVNAKNNY
jgi:hypothetical protein